LEASLVDIADSVAYNSHDIDDGLSSGILNWDNLEAVSIWTKARIESEKAFRDLDRKLRRHSVVRILVDQQVTDLIRQTSRNIQTNNIATLEDVRRSGGRLVSFSEEMREKLDILKQFLRERMYRHPKLLASSNQAKVVIQTLFKRYKYDPQKLHGKFKLRLDKEPVEIIIADFIAGMTDRYALRMYEQYK
ncbi:MAG: deoxyguanosinetriphosphate triphosphohydrolase, partial [candidate division Zixibacteria bacterium]|nr:deoxyguanosinetriphosphate triphosphohydrolase [candidate division Zixibacteria bacterium]